MANFELQLVMVGIKVPLLVLLSLLQLLLGLLQDDLYLHGNLISPHILPSTRGLHVSIGQLTETEI